MRNLSYHRMPPLTQSLGAAFNCVLKSKPKYSLWPLTKDTDNPVIQSKIEANTCRRHEAQENVCQRVTIGFALLLTGLESGAVFFKPITKRSKVNANYFRQSNLKKKLYCEVMCVRPDRSDMCY